MKAKMKQYIRRTKIDSSAQRRYDMRFDELNELCHMVDTQPYEALMLTFRYGFAKGVRMMRSEAKNEQTH